MSNKEDRIRGLDNSEEGILGLDLQCDLAGDNEKARLDGDVPPSFLPLVKVPPPPPHIDENEDENEAEDDYDDDDDDEVEDEDEAEKANAGGALEPSGMGEVAAVREEKLSLEFLSSKSATKRAKEQDQEEKAERHDDDDDADEYDDEQSQRTCSDANCSKPGRLFTPSPAHTGTRCPACKKRASRKNGKK
jgi:hypothetical protein